MTVAADFGQQDKTRLTGLRSFLFLNSSPIDCGISALTEKQEHMGSFWQDLIRSRSFWVDFLRAGVNFRFCPSLSNEMQDEEPRCTVSLSFDFPRGQQLEIAVSSGEHQLDHIDLDCVGSEDARVVWGTMDCHQMSDLFRWEEFQLIIGHLSKTTTGPAWAYELLFSYYVAVTEDCAAEHNVLLRRCLQESHVFTAEEIDHVVSYSKRVARRKDFRWIDVPDVGWVARGDDAYSMRQEGGQFDFIRFAIFMTSVRDG